jgi:hypothetical protein
MHLFFIFLIFIGIVVAPAIIAAGPGIDENE